MNVSAKREPRREDVWRHLGTGREYLVLCRATNKDPNGDPDGLVVYAPMDSANEQFVRTVANFCERFEFIDDEDDRS